MIPDAPSPLFFRDLFRKQAADTTTRQRARQYGPGFLSARTFLRMALLLAILFGVLHVAGLRQYTSILNGTVGSLEAGWETSVFLGTAYILSFLGFVLIAPILTLAAAFMKLTELLLTPRQSPKQFESAADAE